jgi:hypothetical protein
VSVGVFSCVEDNGFFQPVAEPFFQVVQAAEVFCADPGPGFDLEADDLPVISFNDEVYSGDIQHVLVDDQAHVVVEPAGTGTGTAGRRATGMPPDVAR